MILHTINIFKLVHETLIYILNIKKKKTYTHHTESVSNVYIIQSNSIYIEYLFLQAYTVIIRIPGQLGIPNTGIASICYSDLKKKKTYFHLIPK